MDTKVLLNNPDIDESGMQILKPIDELRAAIVQNYRLLFSYNLFFSCKDETEVANYLKKLHILYDETTLMRLALFTRTQENNQNKKNKKIKRKKIIFYL